MALKLVQSFGDSNPTKFIQIMTSDWPLPILQQGQI